MMKRKFWMEAPIEALAAMMLFSSCGKKTFSKLEYTTSAVAGHGRRPAFASTTSTPITTSQRQSKRMFPTFGSSHAIESALRDYDAGASAVVD